MTTVSGPITRPPAQPTPRGGPRVLVAHNLYRSAAPSGENSVVLEDVTRLRAAGVEVATVFTSSDDIPRLPPAARLGVAAGPVINPAGVRRFAAALSSFAPDVVHLHNVFPLLSPWVIRTARAAGVPVVQTVHNYRHTCVGGNRYRDGSTCDDCLGSLLPLPAVRHGCYRESRLQTLPMVVSAVAHRSTWRSVDTFIAPTSFLADQLTRSGIEADRIVVFPNTAADPGPPTTPGQDVLFVGRLEEMKGPDLLVDAWAAAGPPAGARLRIAGSGPLGHALAERARGKPGIELLGRLDAAGVAAQMRLAALVAIPSRCYEAQPRAMVEAFAHGRGVLGSDHGATALLGAEGLGWSVPPTVDAIRAALAVLRDRPALEAASTRARARYEAEHREPLSVSRLVELYASVAARGRRADQG
ncbi:glycosyltransferase [Frankia sp. CNm7]|uniref:Glycosyltransferase n=1 Tax=Frankia nepalensis TaxID=1836974 RepID=A0A937RKM4_9ACTN|nr:glycosyltransferase [Frankia nepalensis]MBL7502679.1 glycosyltransferase [Frankia nepalensis]MBL7515529.1 glycosyltransferase [Frankia nepalensis]MBL7522792.1 glycosyltransferase [Frankia nepalensis]MBL7629064.1 glycosyltransferase [Frankia nepalensis]